MSGEELATLRRTLGEIEKACRIASKAIWPGTHNRFMASFGGAEMLAPSAQFFIPSLEGAMPEKPQSLLEIEKPAHFFVLRGGLIRYMKDETARQEDLAMPEGFKTSERAELALRLVSGRSFDFLETRALLKILSEG